MSEFQEIAEELREYTAMKYAGDCKCGKCQLVPRDLVERIYHTLNSMELRLNSSGAARAMAEIQRDNALKQLGKANAKAEYWRLSAERREQRRELTGLDIPEARTLDAPEVSLPDETST